LLGVLSCFDVATVGSELYSCDLVFLVL
jgi:hypothetical protein